MERRKERVLFPGNRFIPYKSINNALRFSEKNLVLPNLSRIFAKRLAYESYFIFNDTKGNNQL